MLASWLDPSWVALWSLGALVGSLVGWLVVSRDGVFVGSFVGSLVGRSVDAFVMPIGGGVVGSFVSLAYSSADSYRANKRF